MNRFDYHGVLVKNSAVYVGRVSELKELVAKVTSGSPSHILIFGGPNTGKSSLINRLYSQQLPASLHLHHLDMSLLDTGSAPSSTKKFFSYLAKKIIEKEPTVYSGRYVVRNAEDFQNLLRQCTTSHTCFFILDRLSNVPEGVLKQFANILRAMWEARVQEGNEAFQHFLFILVGGGEVFKAARASELPPSRNSPLKDVTINIYLNDLRKDESDALLDFGFGEAQIPKDKLPDLCETIYKCFHGHPYFTQLLGYRVVQHYLNQRVLSNVENEAQNLIKAHEKFKMLLEKAQQEDLLETLQAIHRKEALSFSWGNEKVALLHLMGFIREDEETSHCVIRNYIYTQQLTWEFQHLSPQLVPQTKPKPQQATAPLPASSSLQLFRIELTRAQKQHQSAQHYTTFSIRAENTKGSKPNGLSKLRYTNEELRAVFKVLLPLFLKDNPLKDSQIAILKKRGLWYDKGNRPLNSVSAIRKVGQYIYDTLMVEQIRPIFESAINDASAETLTTLQLHIDYDAVQLAQHPWELMYNAPLRNSLLLSKNIELIRCIMSPVNNTQFTPVTAPLRIVYISSRPLNAPSLPEEEQQLVLAELGALKKEEEKYGRDFIFHSLNPPTFTALKNYLDRTDKVHILHFDGHGSFGRLCEVCNTVTHPSFDRCQGELSVNNVCGRYIEDAPVMGYLLFETEKRDKHYVSSEELGYLLAKKNIRLAILSSCNSSKVESGSEKEYTLFGGTAQMLTNTGIMAVIAMQSVISPKGATTFVQSFYRALLRSHSIVAAVNTARQALMYPSEQNEWFIPTLYAGTDDHNLILFNE